MEVYECIRSKLTVREFKADPVPKSVIVQILRGGRWAASARNRQPWNFIVIEDRKMLTQIGQIASSGSFIGDAPLGIAVVMEQQGRPELDAGRTLQQMELVAWSRGVGGCVVGIRGEENGKVKELLHIPEDKELITVMAFGYPSEEATARNKQRKPLSEIAHGERFGWVFLAG